MAAQLHGEGRPGSLDHMPDERGHEPTPDQITEDALFDVYKPIDAPDGSALFNDFGDVRAYPECHVWTVVDGDEGGMYALAGLHYVNRVGYIVTELPWPDEQAEAVYMTEEEEDDDA